MRSGAFDVAFGGSLKVKHLSYKSPLCVPTTVNKTRRPEEPVLEVAQPFPPADVADAGVRVCVTAVCCVLTLYSAYTTTPYMGTLVNVATLELVPVSMLFADASNQHVAILATGACISLFVCADSMRQPLLTYPTYVCIVLVLVLLVLASPRLRFADSLLVAFTVMAVLSALLLRHVSGRHLQVVQIVELLLLVLCMGTYGFMLHRKGGPAAQQSVTA